MNMINYNQLYEDMSYKDPNLEAVILSFSTAEFPNSQITKILKRVLDERIWYFLISRSLHTHQSCEWLKYKTMDECSISRWPRGEKTSFTSKNRVSPNFGLLLLIRYGLQSQEEARTRVYITCQTYLDLQSHSSKWLEPLIIHHLLVVGHQCPYYSTASCLTLGVTGELSWCQLCNISTQEELEASDSGPRNKVCQQRYCLNLEQH